MAAVLLLLLLLALGAASMMGRTPDSRDEQFTLGRVMAERIPPDP